jgi:ribosomal protein S18 acetylase RimI-like enzyme
VSEPSPELHLVSCNDPQLEQVLSWFSDAREVFYWGGPDISFPLELQCFKSQAKWHKNHSWVLLCGTETVAFGQIYLRLERCHLGRLVVAPEHRGKGLGAELIERLIQAGQELLGCSEASLFVLTDNQPAMHLYRRLGFTETTYPKPIPLANCCYMIRR